MLEYCPHNCWNSEALLLGILEKVEDIIANDNAGFACEDVFDTHDCEI